MRKCRFKVMHGQSELSHAIQTARSTRSFTDLLDRWQQHANQDSDDGDNNQQFDQSECLSSLDSGGTHFRVPQLDNGVYDNYDKLFSGYQASRTVNIESANNQITPEATANIENLGRHKTTSEFRTAGGLNFLTRCLG